VSKGSTGRSKRRNYVPRFRVLADEKGSERGEEEDNWKGGVLLTLSSDRRLGSKKVFLVKKGGAQKYQGKGELAGKNLPFRGGKSPVFMDKDAMAK